jgi:alpha-galactosidase
MIQIHQPDSTGPIFALTGQRSQYLMKVDRDGFLRHLTWGPSEKPAGTASWATDLNPPWLFANEKNYLEYYPCGANTAALPSLQVALGPDCGFEVDPDTESPNFPVRQLDLLYASHRMVEQSEPTGFPKHGLQTQTRRPEVLEIVLRDPKITVELSLFYRIYEDCDIIERWCELRNLTKGSIEVDRMMFATWSLPVGDYGAHTPSGQIFGEFQMQSLDIPRGLTVTTRSGNLTTGHRANPFVLLESKSESSRSYLIALAYSGNWRMDLDSVDAGCLRVHGGEDDLDTRFVLAPGESHRTPASFAGCSNQGTDDLSRKFHQLHRKYLQINYGSRPVLYNSWEATEFNLSLEQQKDLADRAASIGVELFVVDDGWFGGRRHDKAGLGDWHVSPEVFPDGILPLIQHVHGLGMKFGIWFEPEMVNPDSDLYRQHPDWVLHYPGRERKLQRSQLILDFGRPEVVEHIENQLTAFLDEHPVDFIKWDMNRLANPAGSVAGRAIWRKHVAAVYRIMDTLRKRYPKLSLQSCSAGGGRVDLGMAQRVEQFWTSDNTDAFHRIRAQDAFSTCYAPNAMECWVTESPNHQTKRTASLDTRFAVAMRGVLGIGSNLAKCGTQELGHYARNIAFYKQVRHLIQEGNCHILARPEAQNGCSAWWFVAPDSSEGFLSVVLSEHKPGHLVPWIRLPGLIPGSAYTIHAADGTDLPSISGHELLDHGIPAAENPCPVLGPFPGAVRLLHLTQNP